MLKYNKEGELMIFYTDIISKLLGSWSEDITTASIILRMIFAFIIGFTLGIDRSIKRHPAGLRTCTLVSLAAAVCMLLNKNSDGSDSVRLAAGIVTGIGFIGAGTIVITKRNRIKGLTTAAIILVSAVLGLAAGAGFYFTTLVGLILSIATINLLPCIEGFVQRRSKVFDIHVEMESHECVKDFMDYLRNKGVRILDLTLDPSFEATGLGVYTLVLSMDNKARQAVIDEACELNYVRHIEIM